jgi:hypothetical protein
METAQLKTVPEANVSFQQLIARLNATRLTVLDQIVQELNVILVFNQQFVPKQPAQSRIAVDQFVQQHPVTSQIPQTQQPLVQPLVYQIVVKQIALVQTVPRLCVTRLVVQMHHVLPQTVRLRTVLEPTALQQTVQTRQTRQLVHQAVSQIVQNQTVLVQTAR